jgi:hypothetical protein
VYVELMPAHHDGFGGRRTQTTSLTLSRHLFLGQARAVGATGGAAPARAEADANLALSGGPSERVLTKAFPRKGEMFLQRTRRGNSM